jgi:hypothetical protein
MNVFQLWAFILVIFLLLLLDNSLVVHYINYTQYKDILEVCCTLSLDDHIVTNIVTSLLFSPVLLAASVITLRFVSPCIIVQFK